MRTPKVALSDIAELQGKGVHIKDPVNLEYKISKLIEGGTEKLQVIADFDHTITKQHIEGKRHESSFCIVDHCEGLPEDFQQKGQVICDKYIPIERDPFMSYEEKLPHMVDFYNLTSDLYKGFALPPEEFERAIERTKTELREGTASLVSTLEKADVPFLVFSAGLGDVVHALLQHHKVENKNTHVISNFLRYTDGKVDGFQHDLVHPLNKNGQAAAHTAYFQMMCHRKNVLLMGDNLGDADMANGVPNVEVVLKIGFLWGNVAHNLESYMNHFDVVLVDDQTMNLANAILKLIINKK